MERREFLSVVVGAVVGGGAAVLAAAAATKPLALPVLTAEEVHLDEIARLRAEWIRVFGPPDSPKVSTTVRWLMENQQAA